MRRSGRQGASTRIQAEALPPRGTRSGCRASTARTNPLVRRGVTFERVPLFVTRPLRPPEPTRVRGAGNALGAALRIQHARFTGVSAPAAPTRKARCRRGEVCGFQSEGPAVDLGLPCFPGALVRCGQLGRGHGATSEHGIAGRECRAHTHSRRRPACGRLLAVPRRPRKRLIRARQECVYRGRPVRKVMCRRRAWHWGRPIAGVESASVLIPPTHRRVKGLWPTSAPRWPSTTSP